MPLRGERLVVSKRLVFIFEIVSHVGPSWLVHQLFIKNKTKPKNSLHDPNFKDFFLLTVKYSWRKILGNKKVISACCFIKKLYIQKCFTPYEREFLNKTGKVFAHSLPSILQFPYVATLISLFFTRIRTSMCISSTK